MEYKMVVYTCVCCKFETNHKNKYERHLSTKKRIDTSIVEDDRYKVLEDKYKTLEEKYKALEDKFVKDQDIVHFPTSEDDVSDDKVFSDMLSKDDVSDDKVYNVLDMLSKAQYQTPNLEELKLDFHCDDYERNPVDGMIQVLNRIPFKPFQYVNGR